MEQLLVFLPAMWADHHVLTVRGVATGIAGVDRVDASAMERRATISFDPAATSAEAIGAALGQAGFPPGEPTSDEAPPTDKPSWREGGVRTTTTDPADLAMSGDHRKY